MPQATTNRVDFRYLPQVTWDVVPTTPTFTSLRITGETLTHSKNTVMSNEFRSDRQVTDIIQVAAQGQGDVNFELSAVDFDPFFEAMLATTLVTTVHTPVALQATASTSTFTRASGSFITDGFVVGQWIKTVGFTAAANNGYFHLTAVTALTLVVEPTGVLVDEASTAGRTITGKFGRNGVTRKLFILEESFADIGRFTSFMNMVPNQMDLNITAGAIVTGKFSFLGKGAAVSASTLSTGGTPTAAGTNPVYNGTSNVGVIYENGYATALLNFLKSIQFTINNNARVVSALTYLNPANVQQGECSVTGRIEAYFEDSIFYGQFLNHNTISLSVRLTDSSAVPKSYIWTFPAIKYTGGDPQATAKNQDIPATYAFAAFRDATTGCTVQLDIL